MADPRNFGVDESGCLEGTTLPVCMPLKAQVMRGPLPDTTSGGWFRVRLRAVAILDRSAILDAVTRGDITSKAVFAEQRFLGEQVKPLGLTWSGMGDIALLWRWRSA